MVRQGFIIPIYPRLREFPSQQSSIDEVWGKVLAIIKIELVCMWVWEIIVRFTWIGNGKWGIVCDIRKFILNLMANFIIIFAFPTFSYQMSIFLTISAKFCILLQRKSKHLFIVTVHCCILRLITMETEATWLIGISCLE